jgi:sugar phosphate isomerase/epimerase
VSRRFNIVLEEDELEEAIERYGLKNVGYEIHRAFISDLKRKKNHEAVKRAQREARIKLLSGELDG